MNNVRTHDINVDGAYFGSLWDATPQHIIAYMFDVSENTGSEDIVVYLADTDTEVDRLTNYPDGDVEMDGNYMGGNKNPDPYDLWMYENDVQEDPMEYLSQEDVWGWEGGFDYSESDFAYHVYQETKTYPSPKEGESL